MKASFEEFCANANAIIRKVNITGEDDVQETVEFTVEVQWASYDATVFFTYSYIYDDDNGYDLEIRVAGEGIKYDDLVNSIGFARIVVQHSNWLKILKIKEA